MIPVAEASALILDRVRPLEPETVPVPECAGRVLAQDVSAPISSPPWNNSSMDGYAARSADCAKGARLRVVAAIAAGEFPPRALEQGEAMRVMTGAPVPEGADTVIRQEDTDRGSEVVEIRETRDVSRNIRRAGEDFSAGDSLFSAGEELGPAHAGALASAGLREVLVYRRPRVGIVSSGNELVELDDFTMALAGKKIVSSNSLTLPLLARCAGAEPVDLGIARDTRDSLREKLQAAAGCDLIITSAGISVGELDHVRPVFEELGGELVFWKVRMRPGAPMAFGTLNDAPWLGLSGNPVSAMITFELFARPVIRRMTGHREPFTQTLPVRLGELIQLGAPLMHFLRAKLERGPGGEHVATLAGSQSSAVLTAMARADALLIIPGHKLRWEAGEIVRALPLRGAIATSRTLELT